MPDNLNEKSDSPVSARNIAEGVFFTSSASKHLKEADDASAIVPTSKSNAGASVPVPFTALFRYVQVRLSAMK